MAVVLLFDGVDDTAGAATPITNPCPIGKSIIYNGLWESSGNSFQMFIDIYGGSGDFLAINNSGQLTSRIGGVISTGSDSIPEGGTFKYEIERTSTQYKVYLDNVLQYFRNYTADLQSLKGFSYSLSVSQGQLHNCAVGTTNYYDADASVHTAGTPVITDTIAGNNATGVNMPTAALGNAGSAWLTVGGSGISLTATLGTIEYSSNDSVVSLAGSTDVTATLGVISYSSNDTSISLAGSVDLIATLGAINYGSNDSTVQVSGAVNVSATLGAINYTSNNADISLFGNVDIVATLGTINYNSNDTGISLAGGVNVNATLGTIDYTASDTTILLQGQVSVLATLGTISYDSYSVNIQVGSGQFIGTVTAGFANDIYSAGFKPSAITVNFKS